MSRTPTLAPTSPSRALRSLSRGLVQLPTGGVVLDITERRHPRFNLFESHWRFLLESFSGGPEYLFKGMNTPLQGRSANPTNLNSRNLFRYFKEGESEYAERLQRAHRNNYSKRVVTQLTSFLARKPPVRRTEDASEVLNEYWENTDGQGSTIDSTVGLIAQWMMTTGLIWISIDRPAFLFNSRTQELEEGMPFIKFWFPFDVLDAGFDEKGELTWLLVRENRRLDDDPMMPSPVIPHFMLWDREGFQTFVKKPRDEGGPGLPFIKVDEGFHGLGFVPFLPIKMSESEDAFVAPGLLDDVAYLDRDIFNKMSQLDTIILDQTFSQLAIPADAIALNSPSREEAREGAIQPASEVQVRTRMLEMGTKRVFLFNGQTTHPPRYISPDATQADVVRATIKDQTDEIYRLVGLLTQVGREVKTQSGTSKAYDFDRLNKMLASMGDQLQKAETWIAVTVEAWMSGIGETIDKKKLRELVSYPANFDIMGLLERIDQQVRAEELDTWSPTLNFVERVRIMDQMEPNLPTSQRETIVKEMEKRRDREIKMAETIPMDPFADPRQGGDDPSQRNGPGGGARGPGSAQPAKPNVSTANRVEGGNKQEKS